MPTISIRKLFLLILITDIVSCKFQTEEERMTEEAILDTHCNKDLTTQFIESPSEKMIIKALPDMQEICPNINYSCCSYEELSKMSNIVNIKVDSLKRMVTDMESLLEEIKNLDEISMIKTEIIAKDNKCISSSETTLQQGFEYVRANYKQILDDTKIALRFITRRTGSFLCELCNYETGTSTVKFRTDRYNLLVRNDYCNALFNDAKGDKTVNLFYLLSFIEPLSLALTCLQGSKMTFSPIFPEKKWKNISQLYQDCDAEFQTKSTVLTEKCIEMCRTISPLNDNILKNVSSAISMTYIFLKHFITTTTFVQCNETLDESNKNQVNDLGCIYNEPITEHIRDELKTIQTFKYYIEPNQEVTDDLLVDMKWSLSKVEGINPEKNLLHRFKPVSYTHLTLPTTPYV